VTADHVTGHGALLRAEAMHRASLEIDTTLDRLLRPLGVSYARWSLLNVLVTSGPLSIQKLADQAGVHRTTVSGLLRSLQASGHVDVRDDGVDRRCAEVGATAAGRAVFLAGLDLVGAVDWTPLLSRLESAFPIPFLASHSSR
jgi:DNA-binding MarR family transcriptional regulator